MWTRAELIQLILDRERKADAPPQPEPLKTMEQMRQRNLADARAGKCITMNALARSQSCSVMRILRTVWHTRNRRSHQLRHQVRQARDHISRRVRVL
jgi:hypothetical protein